MRGVGSSTISNQSLVLSQATEGPSDRNTNRPKGKGKTYFSSFRSVDIEILVIEAKKPRDFVRNY